MKKGVFWFLLGFIVILSSFMLSCGEKENSSKTIKNDGNTCKITVRGDGDGSVSNAQVTCPASWRRLFRYSFVTLMFSGA